MQYRQSNMNKRRVTGYRWLFLGICYALLFVVQTADAQSGKQELVESFFNEAVNVDINDEQFIKKYMCTEELILKDKKARETHEFFTQQVYRFRMMVRGQSKKITANFGNVITSYKDLAESERNIVIEEKEEDNIFRFKGEQNLVFDILVGNNRILSFTTMNKGGKKVFLLLCA